MFSSPRYVEEWSKAVNVKFKRPSYHKLKEVQKAMGAGTWEDLCNKLYDLMIEMGKIKKPIYKI